MDLAWSIDCFDIMEWARKNGVLYVNTSLESWDSTGASTQRTTFEKSLYVRYNKVLAAMAAAPRHAPTAVLDHGANPGLISHFVKRGLLDIGHILKKNRMTRGSAGLQRLMEDGEFAELARAVGVRVIHCSEWDRQLSRVPKRHEEFVGTWSIEGMWEEAISPSELGWGTHEKRLPPLAIVPQNGPGNQIILPQMGMNTLVRSWVPDQEIVGMLVTHGEPSFPRLTVRRRGRVVYRPTVHYAYSLPTIPWPPCMKCAAAIMSCKPTSGSSPTKSAKVTTGWARCSWDPSSRRGGRAPSFPQRKPARKCRIPTPRPCKWPRECWPPCCGPLPTLTAAFTCPRTCRTRKSCAMPHPIWASWSPSIPLGRPCNATVFSLPKSRGHPDTSDPWQFVNGFQPDPDCVRIRHFFDGTRLLGKSAA